MTIVANQDIGLMIQSAVLYVISVRYEHAPPQCFRVLFPARVYKSIPWWHRSTTEMMLTSENEALGWGTYKTQPIGIRMRLNEHANIPIFHPP